MSATILSRRSVLAAAATLPLMAATRSVDGEWSNLKKAMWVWKDRLSEPDDLSTFCKAQNVGLLFLYVSPDAANSVLSGPSMAREILRGLRAGDRLVFACSGEPDWIDQPKPQLPEHLELLARGLNQGFFDGLALDVEPQALPGWRDPKERDALAARTLVFFDQVRKSLPQATIDGAVNVIFGDIRLVDGDNFLRALAKRLTSVSIMAYRNRVPAAINFAAPATRALGGAGKPWRMGVLVDPDDDEPGTSWSNVPRPQFVAEMIGLDRTLRSTSDDRYAGLAFEGFDGLRTLLGG